MLTSLNLDSLEQRSKLLRVTLFYHIYYNLVNIYLRINVYKFAFLPSVHGTYYYPHRGHHIDHIDHIEGPIGPMVIYTV